jgi:hypothetical protein
MRLRKSRNCVSARDRVRWLVSASLALLATLWFVVGCGGTQQGQKEQRQEAVAPVVGEYVGEIPEADIFLALVAQEPQEEESSEREVRVYLCDGRQLTQWFTTMVSGDAFQGTTASGVQFYASLAPELTIGTIALANGESFDFQIARASGIDGVYPVNVPPDGGRLSGTSWRGGQLEGTRTGAELTGTITPPDSNEEAVGFGISVPTLEEGEDRWIVLTADDGQPRIKGANIV